MLVKLSLIAISVTIVLSAPTTTSSHQIIKPTELTESVSKTAATTTEPGSTASFSAAIPAEALINKVLVPTSTAVQSTPGLSSTTSSSSNEDTITTSSSNQDTTTTSSSSSNQDTTTTSSSSSTDSTTTTSDNSTPPISTSKGPAVVSPTTTDPNTTRRCAPAQWESKVYGKIAHVIDGEPVVYDVVSNSSSDLVNERTVFQEVVRSDDGEVVRATVISDYKQKRAYLIYPDDKKCVSSVLVDDMKEFCDDNTNKVRSFMLGGQMADTYEVDHKYFTFTAKSTITVIRETFEIVSVLTENDSAEHVPRLLAFQYGDFSTGIKDEEIFKIPDYCS